mmetsp:Transcript_23480/g.31105  ORF Transcript_23480/g.31105 Transcript_23480/m.31105 type:complete len:95 (+) Transcript_23480:97-381(+)
MIKAEIKKLRSLNGDEALLKQESFNGDEALLPLRICPMLSMNAYARKCTDLDTDALCFFLSVLCEARIHILEKYIDPDQMLENYPDSHVQRVFK